MHSGHEGAEFPGVEPFCGAHAGAQVQPMRLHGRNGGGPVVRRSPPASHKGSASMASRMRRLRPQSCVQEDRGQEIQKLFS